MKKRILSLTLVTLLVCSMVISASAATLQGYHTYGGECEFFTQEYCTTYSYSSLMEFIMTTNSQKTYKDYSFKVDVYVYGTDSKLIVRDFGTTGTPMCSNSGTTGSEIKFIEADHYVNGGVFNSTRLYN